MVQQKITALYCRLSQEDLLKGESVSISHQKQILQEYADKNGFEDSIIFSDDGYSGTNFDRPAWKELEEQIELGNVATILVKDHSRLGRDRLKMGYLLEEKIIDYNVRYIAINDSVDTVRGVDESLAFRDLFNEWHARDTSKKVKAVKMAAANRGERSGAKPLFGYQRDSNDKKKLVPNKDTAPVVRYIFSLCASGLGPSKIARLLTEEKYIIPVVYDYQTYGIGNRNLNLDRPYNWKETTIATILEKEEYIGTTVNCRTYKPSFKNKKLKQNPKENWLRFENTHEAIIDLETWDIVQKVRSTKRRPNKIGEQDMLSGLIECETCGNKHYICRCGSWNEEQYTYTCGKYRKHKDQCTPHTIKMVALRKIVLTKINQVSEEAKNNKQQFLQRVMDKKREDSKKELSFKRKDFDKSSKRLLELNTIFQKVFEQMALGIITNEQFQILTGNYEKEKVELQIKVEVLQNEIIIEQEKMQNGDNFLKIVDKYTDIKELTPEIVREFIDKIVIHERSERWKKKNYTQKIDVYLNFIGNV